MSIHKPLDDYEEECAVCNGKGYIGETSEKWWNTCNICSGGLVPTEKGNELLMFISRHIRSYLDD